MEHFYSIAEIIEFAISLERASQQFYEKLVSFADEPSVREFLLDLIGQEKMHEAALREAVETAEEAIDGRVPQQEVAAYIQAVKLPPALDYKVAVRIARDKEKASRMLYSILAGATESPTLKKVFVFLARQEAEHQAYFEKEYARIHIGQN